MAYHFIIHTKGFVPFQWSEENTDGLRRNAVITAMDGLKFRESSEKALRWRIGMFLHGAYAECDEADYEAYYAWMNTTTHCICIGKSCVWKPRDSIRDTAASIKSSNL